MKVESVVIDTNVLISSALSTKGVPAQIVKYFILHSKIIFSDETFEEFNSRLWRPKFDRYISHQCSPVNCTRGTNFATRELIKHCKDVPAIIAF